MNKNRLTESILTNLNEQDNRTEIEEFAEKLNKLIQADGLDTMRNGDLLYVIKETENGKASMNVEFYEGGNNIADYEVNYIGLGGDTLDDITVSPIAKSGWEQENGDPRGTQFEDGHECWAEACPLSKTSPEEVAEIIKSSFDAIDNQITESSRYTDIEDNDPILDKEIDVYDINAFVDENINGGENNYKSYNFDHGAAIIVTSKGNGCILDFEAVGTSFDSVSDDYKLYLAPKDSKDEKGNMTFALVPTATVNVKIEELMTAPSKKMKVRDFFYKYGYNDRCARNFDEIKHYLTECDKTLKEADEGYPFSENYYVINEEDFNKLVDLTGGVFEKGYVEITKDEFKDIADKHGFFDE